MSKYLVHTLKVARSTHLGRKKNSFSPLGYLLEESVQSIPVESWNVNCVPYFSSPTLGSIPFFFFSSILISVNFPNELTEDVITGKAADPTKKSN